MTPPGGPATTSSRLLLFGTDEPVPETLRLQAGRLTMGLRGGALHDLRWDGREAWHAVTFPYRDADWWTPPFVVERLVEVPRPGGFRVEVRGRFETDPRLRTVLAVDGDGERLRIDAEAVPEGDIETNRLGLCLLYPTAAAGSACEIEHDDGRVSRSTFPKLVPPWPPFMQIRAIRHEVAPGCWASCIFSGDSFEFEDQRNNADASFKVYSRSNLMPRPYRLRAGVPVRQGLELRVEDAQHGGGSVIASEARTSGRTVQAPDGRRLPRLGLAVRIDIDRDLLRRVATVLRPSFLHGTIEAGELAAAAPEFAALAREAGVPLHLDLLLADRLPSEAELALLRTAAPEAVALFPTQSAAVAAVRRVLPEVPVGGGTPHFFAQINRIEDLGPVDFLTFTVSPLVHGAADDEVMRSPGTLPGLAATLAHRWPGRTVHLGPSAIAMRASPLGRQLVSDGRGRRAMASDDPRARGLFGAAWALAMIAGATEAGLGALTLMSVDGPSGVARRRADGGVEWYPVWAVLARLGRPAEVVPPPVAPAARLVALAFRRGGTRRMLLANLGAEPIEADLRDWALAADCELLDEEALCQPRARDGSPAFRPCPTAPRLTLGPYAVADLREVIP